MHEILLSGPLNKNSTSPGVMFVKLDFKSEFMSEAKYAYLKKARKKLNFSQQELADLTGISLRTIQRIENDEVVPRPFTLRKLEAELNVAGTHSMSDVYREKTFRLVILIQWLSLLLPVIYAFLTFLLWKKGPHRDRDKDLLGRIVSLEIYQSLLFIPISLAFTLILRNYGFQVSYGQWPLLFLIYWFLTAVFSIYMTFQISSELKSQRSSLPVFPSLLRSPGQ